MPRHDAAALLLPGMSLNATIFPDLGIPHLAPDFSHFAPAGSGMDPYIQQVSGLTGDPLWREAHFRIVVAHSFGGMLALSWLLAQPAMQAHLHGLVLAGTTAGPMFEAVRLRVAWWGARALRIGTTPLMALWDRPWVTRGLHRVLNRERECGNALDFRQLPYQDDIRVGLAGWRAIGWEARRAFRAAMRNYDVRDRLERIDVPTIVLHGDRDCYFTERNARVLADGLPRGELRVIAGAGHVLPLTHGDAVRRAVDDLLRRAG